MTKITIEIEDTHGNTIGAINLANNEVIGDISFVYVLANLNL